MPAARDLHRPLRRAALVAAAAYLTQLPYLVYLARVAYPDALRERYKALTPEDLLALDLARVAVLVIIAALVGAIFSERNGLPGLGDRRDARRVAPWVLLSLGLGFAFTALGEDVRRALPGQFPCELGWAAVAMLKSAVFDEVVARYGMMTLMVGVLKRRIAANLLQAAFFAAVGARALFFDGDGRGPGLDPVTLASVASAFGVALLCGHIYARHGLVPAILAHLALGVRFLAHALSC